MLNSLGAFNGASVIASDGQIGKVQNFLFDDQSWMIRYFVVDVGGWLTRQAVVLAVTVAEQADWNRKSIQVRLSKEQVRHSPDIDTTKPVSRQQEIAMREHYGWPAYWGAGELPLFNLPAGKNYPVHNTEDDPHLRSAWSVAGYEVWDANDEMGHLEDFFVDDSSWHLGYLDVKAGDWLHSRALLVPTPWVESVSWPDHRVYLKKARKEL